MLVRGVLFLSSSVVSHRDTLAVVRHVNVGGIQGSVLFPGPDPQSLGLGEPRPLEPPPVDSSLTAAWGLLNSPTGPVTIEALGLHLEVECPANDSDFLLAVEAWEHRLTNWLQILADGPTSHLGAGRSFVPVGEPELSQDDIWYPRGQLYKEDWEHAIDHASKGDEPPLPYVMIYEAETQSAMCDTRQSLLAAATAVELAVGTWLTERLGQGGKDLVDPILSQIRSLGPKLSVARKLGMSVGEHLQKTLVEPRNKVVHRGWAPDERIVSQAVDSARGLVEEHVPLPECCERLRDPQG